MLTQTEQSSFFLKCLLVSVTRDRLLQFSAAVSKFLKLSIVSVCCIFFYQTAFVTSTQILSCLFMCAEVSAIRFTFIFHSFKSLHVAYYYFISSGVYWWLTNSFVVLYCHQSSLGFRVAVVKWQTSHLRTRRSQKPCAQLPSASLVCI